MADFWKVITASTPVLNVDKPSSVRLQQRLQVARSDAPAFDSSCLAKKTLALLNL